ncbi:MAG: flagellar basal body L-ring protein FlgH [Fimbriimonadaceae bacterium]
MIPFLLAILLWTQDGAASAAANDNPGSLWSNETKNPFLDRTARKEGDIVTIIISETSTATFSATTETQRTEANSVAKPVVPILSAIAPWMVPNLSGSTNGNLGSKGSGTTQSVGKFQARMSAVVKQVLPNGNLVIEGTRYVRVNKDLQTFVLSGIVRPDDVRPDNTVLSESIAEADLRVDGKGAISEKQRKGILSRILDWLF